MNDRYLTVGEAAELLNVHPETLRRWDNDGTLIAIRINDRGDRRYKESDVLKFAQYGRTIPYKGYSIKWDSQGFLSMPANFGLIARIIVFNDETQFIGFAFAVDGLSLFARTGLKDDLDKLATEKVKKYIENKKLSDEDMYTFEFTNGQFREVQNPEWWKGKYSKSLVPGLRIEANITHPTTSMNKAWRVILTFKSKEGDQWFKNPFGKERNFSEYFVWIDSTELMRKGLPNTAKAAEILAVNYGINRFNETKDEHGDRDITRINENNAACFDGKCIKDCLLPDELLK